MFLFHRIEILMMHYSDARYAVAKFVLQEKDSLYKYTINDVAAQTYTSKSTVVRFAKTLGYDGWKEFMKDFIEEIKYQEMHQDDVDANYPFNENDSSTQIIDNIKKLQIESIEDTADLLDEAMLEKATSYLMDSKHILIFGCGQNIFLGELFRRKMILIGKHVDIVSSDEAGTISHALGNEDCAIIISYSGNNETLNPMLHVKTLLENKVHIVGITNAGDNYLRQKLDCVLTMSTKERLYSKIANYATEESIQFLLNVLYSNYYAKDYQNNNSFKVGNAKKLEQARIATIKEMREY